MDKKFAHCRHKKRSEHSKIPLLGSDPVEIVLRVSLPAIEARKQAIFDVGDIKFFFLEQTQI